MLISVLILFIVILFLIKAIYDTPPTTSTTTTENHIVEDEIRAKKYQTALRYDEFGFRRARAETLYN